MHKLLSLLVALLFCPVAASAATQVNIQDLTSLTTACVKLDGGLCVHIVSGGGGVGGILGYQQISSATLAAATSPTVPTGTLYIDIEPEGSAGTNNVCVRWRDDGVAPTGGIGNPQAPLQNYLGVFADLTKIQFINATGATCALSLRYTK